jgi:hypothetical protein
MDFYHKVVETKKLEPSLQCLMCFPVLFYFCLSLVIIRDSNKQREGKDGTKMKRHKLGV